MILDLGALLGSRVAGFDPAAQQARNVALAAHGGPLVPRIDRAVSRRQSSANGYGALAGSCLHWRTCNHTEFRHIAVEETECYVRHAHRKLCPPLPRGTEPLPSYPVLTG